MGERGPLPKQNPIRRNHRDVTGTIAVSRPTMPRDLPDEAKAEWRRVVPLIEQMGLLTKLDRAVLIRYCRAWAEWVELDAQLAATGKLVKGQKGNLVRNPLWLMRQDVEKTVTELSRQLGLSPAARARSGVKHQPPEATTSAPSAPAGMTDFEAERKRRLMSAS